MDELWTRFVEDLLARISGPMKFRFVLQPVMASIFAIKAGLEDAKAGRPPYFWALLTNPGERAVMLRDGWKSVGKVFLLALALDIAFQVFVLHAFYPVETLVVAFLLAILPYLILRGLVTRIAR